MSPLKLTLFLSVYLPDFRIDRSSYYLFWISETKYYSTKMCLLLINDMLVTSPSLFIRFEGPPKGGPLPGPAPAGRPTHLNRVDRHVRLHLQQYINYLYNIICVEGWQENKYNTIQ